MVNDILVTGELFIVLLFWVWRGGRWVGGWVGGGRPAYLSTRYHVQVCLTTDRSFQHLRPGLQTTAQAGGLGGER